MSSPRKEQLADDVTLWLGDCRDIMPMIGRVDAFVTDPPYGVNLGKCGDPRGGSHGKNLRGYETSSDSYEEFVAEIVPRINACLDIAKRAVVWSGPHVWEQRKPDAIGGVFCPAGTGRTGWGFKQFLPALLYGSSPTVAMGMGATHPTAIESGERPSEDSKGHPVPKPLGWMMWSVNLASLPGETVLDAFMGSGTTGVACIDLGRRFIGIEREPKYFDIACRRLSEALRRPRLPFEEPRKAVQAELFAEVSA